MQETVRAAVSTYFSPDGAEITEEQYLKMQYPERREAADAESAAPEGPGKQEGPAAAPSGSTRKRR